jgi:hypothetical protein
VDSRLKKHDKKEVLQIGVKQTARKRIMDKLDSVKEVDKLPGEG